MINKIVKVLKEEVKNSLLKATLNQIFINSLLLNFFNNLVLFNLVISYFKMLRNNSQVIVNVNFIFDLNLTSSFLVLTIENLITKFKFILVLCIF